jgi:hypothetical protein
MYGLIHDDDDDDDEMMLMMLKTTTSELLHRQNPVKLDYLHVVVSVHT